MGHSPTLYEVCDNAVCMVAYFKKTGVWEIVENIQDNKGVENLDLSEIGYVSRVKSPSVTGRNMSRVFYVLYHVVRGYGLPNYSSYARYRMIYLTLD